MYSLLFVFLASCSNADFNGRSDSKDKKQEPAAADPATDGNDGGDTESVTEPVDPGPEPTNTVAETPPTGCIPKDLSDLPGWSMTLENDTLIVSGDGSSNTLKAVGNDQPATIVFSSGSGKTVTVTCGTKLIISGAGAADAITIGGIKGLTAVEINGDDGNDSITVISEGDAEGIPLTINGGSGDDQINVSGGGGYGGVAANGD